MLDLNRPSRPIVRPPADQAAASGIFRRGRTRWVVRTVEVGPWPKLLAFAAEGGDIFFAAEGCRDLHQASQRCSQPARSRIRARTVFGTQVETIKNLFHSCPLSKFDCLRPKHVHPATAAVASDDAIRRPETQSTSSNFNQARIYADAGGVGALAAGEYGGSVHGVGICGFAAVVQ